MDGIVRYIGLIFNVSIVVWALISRVKPLVKTLKEKDLRNSAINALIVVAILVAGYFFVTPFL